MFRLLVCAGAIACLFFWSAVTLAYNEAGHMVSGSVAYAVLQKEYPETLKQVVAILKKHPQYDEWKRKLNEIPAEDRDQFLLMLAARWPDDARGNKQYNHPKWHYVDFPWRPEGQPESLALREPEEENALSAMKENLEILKRDLPDSEKAIAICWVAHLAGDIHQPLHTISAITQDLPHGDAGGTKVFIIPPGFEKPLSLHFFWDDLILNNDCFDMARRRAMELQAKPDFAKEKLIELAEPDYHKWAKNESFELAKKVVYRNGALVVATDPSRAVLLPEDYPVQAKMTAERQIVLSGYRLAALLNQGIETKASQ